MPRNGHNITINGQEMKNEMEQNDVKWHKTVSNSRAHTKNDWKCQETGQKWPDTIMQNGQK